MALNNIEFVQVLLSKVNSFLLTFKHLSGTKWVWLMDMAQVLQQRNQQQLVGNCKKGRWAVAGVLSAPGVLQEHQILQVKMGKKNLRNGKLANLNGNQL